MVLLTHNLLDYVTDIGTIVRLPQRQRTQPDKSRGSRGSTKSWNYDPNEQSMTISTAYDHFESFFYQLNKVTK